MRTPSEWHRQVYLMNFPLSVSNAEPNNAWMTIDDTYDVKLACEQWTKLYARLARDAVVYLLPGHDNLQDLPFVANIGCMLPHLDVNVALLSRFTSKPRFGEEILGRKFFESCNFIVRQPPACWEGEADLKWIRNNVYVGGIGARSTPGAFRWISRYYNADILEIHLDDPKLYHLDCVFLPIAPARALVNVSALRPDDVKKLEKLVDIVAVPEKFKYESWTNALPVGNTLLHSAVRSAVDFHRFMDGKGFFLECFDLREFEKSGADLSCLVMHLNMRRGA